MARLQGFARSAGANTAGLLDLYEKRFLNMTPAGKFNTTEEVDSFITVLESLPQDTRVQTRLAKMRNLRLQLEGKRTDLISERGVFDMALKEELNFKI